MIEKVRAENAQLRYALEVARHGLVTQHGSVATDIDGLLPEHLSWTIDLSHEIATVDKALAGESGKILDPPKRQVPDWVKRLIGVNKHLS